MPESKRKFYLQKVDEMMPNLSMDLINLTLNTAGLRNTLNHFGFQKDEIDYRKFQRKLEELFKKLKEIMEEEHVVWE